MAVGMVLLTLGAIAWLYFLWSRRKLYLCAFKMGGPMGFPLGGIIHKVYKVNDILYVFQSLVKEYKRKTYFTWLGTKPFIYTIDPKVIEIILTSPDCFNKPSVYNIIDKAIGHGILTSKPPTWNKYRRIVNPTVNFKILEKMLPMFNAFARDLCAEIGEHVGRGEFDMQRMSVQTTFRTSMATTMGDQTPITTASKLLHAIESLSEFVVIRLLRPYLHTDTIFRWSKFYKPYKQKVTFATNYTRDIIANKIKAMESSKQDTKSEQDLEEKRRASSYIYLDHTVRLIQQNVLSFQEVMNNAHAVIIAFYETSANALFSTLLFLAMNPTLQDRVFDEISTYFDSNHFDVTEDDFKDLVYLEMCINESLRLAPSIPIIGRVVEKDVPISEDVTLPAGGEIYIDIFNLHRDKDIWGPEAEVFNPDNFLPSNIQSRHKFAYIPFSKGKRNCIGWQYGLYFLRIMLVQILQQYKFSTKSRYEDLKFSAFIALKYENLPLLEVERR